MSRSEDRGHQRIRCRACGYAGWSEETGLCPRCPVPPPAPTVINPGIYYGWCESCRTQGRIYHVEEEWLCGDCRADWREARRLGMP